VRSGRLAAVALLGTLHGAAAQPTESGGTGLEACFRMARLDDAICAKLTNDPTQRLECFQKARSAELECLEHVLSEAPAAGAVSQPATSQPAPATPPEPAASSDAPSKVEASRVDAPAAVPEPPTASISRGPPQTAAAAGAEPGKRADAPVAAEGAAAAVRSDPPREGDLRESSWIVSETTSPIDYSPLLTAVIRPASRLQDGPSSLVIRCRGGRTELSVRSEGGWHPTRNDGLLVDHRVNKEPIIRLMWSLSADAKTATYREDAVELLRSMPEGALLSISIPDGDKARREATFLLTGWGVIRQKIERLCNWPVAGERASARPR